jgi:hypothetical protein
MISRVVIRRGSIITILNYDKWQPSGVYHDDPKDTREIHERYTSDTEVIQTGSLIEELKKEISEKKELLKDYENLMKKGDNHWNEQEKNLFGNLENLRIERKELKD